MGGVCHRGFFSTSYRRYVQATWFNGDIFFNSTMGG